MLPTHFEEAILRVRIARLSTIELEKYIQIDKFFSFTIAIRNYTVEVTRVKRFSYLVSLMGMGVERNRVYASINCSHNTLAPMLQELDKDPVKFQEKYSFCFFLNAKYKEEE